MTTSIEETFKRQQTKLKIKKSFIELLGERGYLYYEPEAFERYESFLKVNERVEASSMVKILDNLGNILVLRPDVTTTIINQLIPRFQQNATLKLFYDTDVFVQSKGEPINKLAQFGVEYLQNDTQNQNADSEIVNLMLTMSEQFNIDYVVEIGNQKFLNALFNQLDLNDERLKTLKEIITFKNVSLLPTFIKENNITGNAKQLLEKLFSLEGSIDKIESALQNIALDDAMCEAIEALKSIRQNIDPDILSKRITFDLSMLSRYDYYQGITFQGFAPNSNSAIMKGGRYNPINRTTNKRVSAIGFTIDMDAFVKEVSNNG